MVVWKSAFNLCLYFRCRCFGFYFGKYRAS